MSIAIARRIANALNVRSETQIRSLNTALTEYVRLTQQSPTTTVAGNIDASQVISGTFLDARIAASNVTQHEAAIDHDNLLGFVANEHIAENTLAVLAEKILGAGLGNFADDAAAATGGVPVGGFYRNASVVQVRVT